VRHPLHIQVPTASRSGHLLCPVCNCGKLQRQGPNLPIVCDLGGCALEGGILRTLQEIATLPDALGEHACECGHPEMRRLQDDVLYCPACHSEVLPIPAHSVSQTKKRRAHER
jgi:uncharacterized Zn finger protein (UPF0148 family)